MVKNGGNICSNPRGQDRKRIDFNIAYCPHPAGKPGGPRERTLNGLLQLLALLLLFLLTQSELSSQLSGKDDLVWGNGVFLEKHETYSDALHPTTELSIRDFTVVGWGGAAAVSSHSFL